MAENQDDESEQTQLSVESYKPKTAEDAKMLDVTEGSCRVGSSISAGSSLRATPFLLGSQSTDEN